MSIALRDPGNVSPVFNERIELKYFFHIIIVIFEHFVTCLTDRFESNLTRIYIFMVSTGISRNAAD